MFKKIRKIMSYFCSVLGLMTDAIGQLLLLLIEKPQPPIWWDGRRTSIYQIRSMVSQDIL